MTRRLEWPILILSCLLATQAFAQRSITQADLIARLTDLERLTRPPIGNERARLYASFDRRQLQVENGKYVNWDADDDFGQFLGKSDDGWDILVDQAAPGALTRWWVDEPKGRVRVEVDGRAVIEDELAKLFSGAVAPFGAPLSGFVAKPRGALLHFPIPFAKSCRVLTKDFKGRYQIDAIEFAAGTQVQPFTPELDEPAQKALDAVLAALAPNAKDENLFRGRRTATHAVQEDVAPGKSFAEDLKGGGVIRAIYVSLTDRTEPRMLHALHNCIIRITWDGAAQPAVELPLAAFFGSGFDRNLYNSLVMGTDRWLELPGVFPSESWFMYCLLPMPYANGARIEIENRNAKPIGLMLYMRVEKATPPPDSMRLFTRFRVENPCKLFDYPLLEAAGPGRVVGCVLNVDTPRDEWWGRGDHKAWIDDDRGPSILGTGTADLFGNTEPLTAASGPYCGTSLVNPHGKNSLYRWLLADSIEFQRGLRLTIENWQPQQQRDLYYSSVVYWYGAPSAARAAPAGANRLEQDDLALPGLRIPGAVEIEGRVSGKDWGQTVAQRDAARVEYSGRSAVQITTSEPVEIALVAEQAGKFTLGLRTHPSRSFGSVKVVLPSGAAVGEARYDREADGAYSLGTIDLSPGPNPLIVTCDRPTILDCWVLTPVR